MVRARPTLYCALRPSSRPRRQIFSPSRQARQDLDPIKRVPLGELGVFARFQSPVTLKDGETSILRSQIKLGRVFGIQIGLHYSWFLIALLIVLSLSSQFHAGNPEWGEGVILVMALATAVLFFVSLLLHELAHSLVA